MNNLSLIFEELLNENPNQAIKFLKEKGMDPTVDENNHGRRILNAVNYFTKGDGYTAMMVKFHVNERKPFNELAALHQYIRDNKDYLQRLPQPILNYETSRQLQNDISRLESEREMMRFMKQLSPLLKDQLLQLNPRQYIQLEKLAGKFKNLSTEKQRHFMSKVFGYKDIKVLMNNLSRYIEAVANAEDFGATKEKIVATQNADIAYEDPVNEILIVHIGSFDAMKKLGCTANWCIARDMSRYRQYKAGGKYYFFIWDFKYKTTDPRFFIATAFNPTSPESSATHEHINDKSLTLGNVLANKNLDFGIFENFITKYKKTFREKYDVSTGLAKALRDNDTDVLLDLIRQSQILAPYRPQPDVDWDHTTIDLNIKEDALIEVLELGDDFSSIASIARYSYNDYASDDEADYMWSSLDNESQKMAIELARKLGADNKTIQDFSEQEKFAAFLEKYGFDSIVQQYNSDYGSAQAEAEQRECQQLVDGVPFNVHNVEFDIEKMLQFYIDNELTADNFDELIEQIKPHLPTFSWDSVNDARYSDLDLDDLNNNFKEDMTRILSEIESDEDNIHYRRARMINDSNKLLERMKFKIYDGSDYTRGIAQYNSKTMKVTIDDIYSDEDDENPTVMINARIEDKTKKPPKKRSIKIPISSLINYMEQKELKLAESKLRLLNILNELFTPGHIYPFHITEDKSYKSIFDNQPMRVVRYEFTTKDDVTYNVLLNIWKNEKLGRIDFHTRSKNSEHSSIIHLINTHDSIKVFNTLKAIVEAHKSEIKTLMIGSVPERVEFYKKMINHLGVKTSTPDVPGSTHLMAHIGEDLEYEKVSDASPESSLYTIGKEVLEQGELGDDWMDVSSEERAERLFGKMTNLQKQFHRLVVDKLSSDDEIVAYKWSVYNALMIEIGKDDDLMSEIAYRLTGGENPDKLFLNIISRVPQTKEVLRLKEIIESYKDINSEKDLDNELEELLSQ